MTKYNEIAKENPNELVRLFNEDRKAFEQLTDGNSKTILQRLEASHPEFINSIDSETRQKLIANHEKHQHKTSK